MNQRFLIERHSDVITAAEVQDSSSIGASEPVLRFASLDELLGHFAARGVPDNSLRTVRNSVNATGVAMLSCPKRQ